MSANGHEPGTKDASSRQTAELAITTSPFAVNARVSVTPFGLLSISALVVGILLATAVIVRVAKDH